MTPRISGFGVRTSRCSQPQAPRVGVLAVVLALAAAGAATAQSQPERSEPTADSAPMRGTPRAAVRGYLETARKGDYRQAAAYLDLSALPPTARTERGPALARQLKVVLDRTLWVDVDAVSDGPDGDPDDDLPPRRDRLGSIETARGPVPILVERGRDAISGAPIWQIAAGTVAQIPALYAEFGYGRLGEHLPAVLFEVQFLEIQLWQWISLLILVPLAVGVSWLATAVLLRLARSLTGRPGWQSRFLLIAPGPLRVAIAVNLFGAGAAALGLALPVDTLFGTLRKTLTYVAFTWLLVRGVDVVAGLVTERLTARGQAVAPSVGPLARRTAQVLVITLASIALLQNLDINVTGVLAGLGIGGLAVALAAQKTVENLFGGATLVVDQPVRVGDFCRFNDTLGTVEEIGLRSTRVRTLERTLVTIPNAQFAAMPLENFSRRDHIWFHATIGLRYETTPDQLRSVLLELKKLLIGDPRVYPDPARARFVGFGAFSLDIEIFAYISTSDINEFLAIREDLLLRITDLVDASGSSFAFPSQTIYAAPDKGLDADKGTAAEAQVRQWREANALGLPNFRSEQLAALANQIDYPPQGSAMQA